MLKQRIVIFLLLLICISSEEVNRFEIDEKQKEKYYKTIKETEAILYENGFVIDTDGVLKKITK